MDYICRCIENRDENKQKEGGFGPYFVKKYIGRSVGCGLVVIMLVFESDILSSKLTVFAVKCYLKRTKTNKLRPALANLKLINGKNS